MLLLLPLQQVLLLRLPLPLLTLESVVLLLGVLQGQWRCLDVLLELLKLLLVLLHSSFEELEPKVFA